MIDDADDYYRDRDPLEREIEDLYLLDESGRRYEWGDQLEPHTDYVALPTRLTFVIVRA